MLAGWLKEIEQGRLETEMIPLELSGLFGKQLSGQGNGDRVPQFVRDLKFGLRERP